MQGANGLRAMIVGAGMGGLTAAIALRRASMDVVVLERADNLKKIQVGAGLQVRNNGMRVMQQLGLAEGVEAAGLAVERYEFLNWNGKYLGAWPVGEFGREIGVPCVAIKRGELHRVLAEAVPPEVIQLSAACAGFTQDESGVTVRFADGREERGDVLIDASGMKSVIREQLLGENKPRYAGFTVRRAICEFEHKRIPERQFVLWYGRGARFAAYHVAPKQLYWFGLSNAEEEGKDPEGGRKAAVQKIFRGCADPVEAIIEATPEAAMLRSDTYGHDPVDHWGQGRVTLLGDSAHSMPFTQGQGANQAMEDALVLARCLSEQKDVAAALRAYEAQRIPRTTQIAQLAWRLARVARMENPVACSVRDMMMKFVLPRIWNQQKEELTYEF
jgi:2-polyprenyl-6-methoxyphenol hydroxylase-like FAD-dependent oxidoreductase